jgi:hypothetical protein
MAVKLLTNVTKYMGLSTDTKPTSVLIGSTFFEYDTSSSYRTYDGTNWVIESIGSYMLPATFNLQQAANTYDLYTATSGSVYVVNFTFTLPNVDVSDDATITSIKVETDTTVVVQLITVAQGAKANLTANKAFLYTAPFALPSTKKIRITIAGGASDASTLCNVTCRWLPINPAGYLA